MSGTPAFHVRELGEGPDDVQFMLDAFDAALPELAAIGSGDQWGSRPVSKRPNLKDRLKVERVRKYQSTGEGDFIRIFILEAEIPPTALEELPASVRVRTVGDAEKKFLAVGFAMLSEGSCPEYIRAQFDKELIKKELDGTTDYSYLDSLITDYRTGPWRKGSGAMLVEHARQVCRGRGKKLLYLDAYAGNDRKLVKYYEKQGFSVVDYFESPKPGSDSKWPGALLRMNV